MEHKRYQIFLSSTFSDLEIERQQVMQALLEMDCIPSGMEFFPASDEETFEFIKTVIDSSDYYILIVAGRYGSVAPDGISYTEKEYDYAIEIGIPVLAFVRSDLGKISVGNTDQDPAMQAKLESFRSKVDSARVVKMWNNSDQLAGQVATTLSSAIRRYPRVGWIRGDQQPSTQILTEINQLRKDNDNLREKIKGMEPSVSVPNLASLDDTYNVRYEYRKVNDYLDKEAFASFTWGDILKIIGNSFRTHSSLSGVDDLESQIERDKNLDIVDIDNMVRVEILTQLEIMGIMTVASSQKTNRAVFYKLTERGLQEYLRRMAITKPDEHSS